MEQIKVFGDKAKAIKEGQLFVASIGNVEGCVVVTLVPVEETDYFERQDHPEQFEDTDTEREAIEEELEYRVKMEGHLS